MLCPCAPTPIFFMPLHWLVPQHLQHPLSDDLASSLGCPPDPLEHRRQMQRIWCWMAMAIKIEVFLTSWVEVEFQIYILKYHIFLRLIYISLKIPTIPNIPTKPTLPTSDKAVSCNTSPVCPGRIPETSLDAMERKKGTEEMPAFTWDTTKLCIKRLDLSSPKWDQKLRKKYELKAVLLLEFPVLKAAKRQTDKPFVTRVQKNRHKEATTATAKRNQVTVSEIEDRPSPKLSSRFGSLQLTHHSFLLSIVFEPCFSRILSLVPPEQKNGSKLPLHCTLLFFPAVLGHLCSQSLGKETHHRRTSRRREPFPNRTLYRTLWKTLCLEFQVLHSSLSWKAAEMNLQICRFLIYDIWYDGYKIYVGVEEIWRIHIWTI